MSRVLVHGSRVNGKEFHRVYELVKEVETQYLVLRSLTGAVGFYLRGGRLSQQQNGPKSPRTVAIDCWIEYLDGPFAIKPAAVEIGAALAKYVEQKNLWLKLDDDAIELPRDKQRVREMIECDLSPENLTCDGELPIAQVKARAKLLNAALADLDKLA